MVGLKFWVHTQMIVETNTIKINKQCLKETGKSRRESNIRSLMKQAEKD